MNEPPRIDPDKLNIVVSREELQTILSCLGIAGDEYYGWDDADDPLMERLARLYKACFGKNWFD